MPSKDSILIGQILIEEGVINAQQLEKGLVEQKKSGEFICTTLVKLGFAPEEKIFNVLARQLNIPYVKLKDKDIDSLIIQKVPAKFASHYKIIPLEFKDNTLIVATTDPFDIRTLDDIKLLLGVEVKGVLATEIEIQEAIRKYYGVGAETLERMITEKSPAQELRVQADIAEDLEVMAEDASIITFVNQIFSEAIKQGATDIHLEPFQNELRTRFRIDGVLYDINIPETIKYFQPAIVSRIKIMARMNIAEHRLPQDGRIKIKLDEEELDLRVSILPTVFGEAVQIRILSQRFFLELEKLGLLKEDLKVLETVIKKPHGVIFVTGPTGSGKSTTLYAALARINSSEVKIITIEDPVEYQLRGVNQIQVIPQIGFNFATALRHMLRHDPDVMMVGEVRDYETAEIAIRSALTGHLVFSTLHTNDAAGAITRLLDMGVEPFLVSSSLECLIAQRLVRVICPKCKKPVKSQEDILAQCKGIEFDASNIQLFEGQGCEYCRFTGYRGRTAIYEILTITESIREMILNHSSSQQIKQKAIAEGMRSLRHDGLHKVLSGITTLTEVIRVTQQEELPED
ncbi:MAG: Flp pilus assembly complex ATPase component TadA [Candidatus Omnitrophica bacterium]|nr:Flp pilus assembly complex ATPase component TadA [Candidatus Omnitrophota bacterium]